MDKASYYKWQDENCISSERRCYNGIDYIFARMKDGWIAISEIDAFGIYPQIQSKDMEHAESWCIKRERLNFAVNELVPRKEEQYV